MTLKINLKPREAVYVGTTSITVVSEGNVTLAIDGDAPILRSSERIDEPLANDHAARLQYVIQQMFLARDLAGFYEEYFALAQRLSSDNADLARHIARTNYHLAQGELYKALKSARALVEGSDSAVAKARVCRG